MQEMYQGSAAATSAAAAVAADAAPEPGTEVTVAAEAMALKIPKYKLTGLEEVESSRESRPAGKHARRASSEANGELGAKASHSHLQLTSSTYLLIIAQSARGLSIAIYSDYPHRYIIPALSGLMSDEVSTER
eukprot:scaffold8341_cov23-Prasinocladus_malaysianus.AAC.2